MQSESAPSRRNAQLFGGTLLCAGLAATASAQPAFNWGATTVAAYAAYGTVNLDTFAGSGNGSVYAFGQGGGYGYGYGGGTELTHLSTAEWDTDTHTAETLVEGARLAELDQTPPGGYLSTTVPIQHQFTLSEDAYLDISWTFADASDALLTIRDATTQSVLFIRTEGTSGIDTITLAAGSHYTLEYFQIANGFLDGSQSNAHALTLRAIPAPGAAGLLALWTIAATRRR